MSVFLVVSGCMPTWRQYISGELKGADGAPLLQGQVFLTRLEGNFSQPLVSATVDAEGRFSLVAPSPGDYRVWLVAPGHPLQDLYVQVPSGGGSVTFQATLASYRYRERIDAPTVIGSWNDYAFGDAEPMQAQADGTFVYERAVEGDVATYQVLGLTEDVHSVPGTQAEGYTLDPGGDFQCQVPVKDGRIRIVLDPRKLSRGKQGALLDATFAPPQAHLGRVNALRAEAAAQGKAATEEFMARRGKGAWEVDYGALSTKLAGILKDTREPLLLREVAALELLGLPFLDLEKAFPGEEGKALAAEALRLLPVTNSRWALAPRGVGRLVALQARSEQEALLKDFASRSPVASARAGALVALLHRANHAGDTTAVAELRAQLQAYAPGNPLVRTTLEFVGAKHEVEAGRAVPDFSAELLDGQGPVSRASLTGRFYLIDFWAVWCVPCVEELPGLHAAFEKFKGRGGFTILSVSMDGDAARVKSFRDSKWKMPWLHAFVGKDFNAPLPKAFEVRTLPSTFLVDAQGRIVATGNELRGDQLERTLDTLLP